MPMTTIKLDTAIRDRLKEEARARGITLGTLLGELVSISERETRFAAIGAAIASTGEAELEDYLAETGEWDNATLRDGVAES
ncbi:hypothetical protein [Rhodococcus sp. NPDC058481]|uniref:hypothetical protein n=1 Tax=unclassified Rhodococcus (in: high G+C Gram-positive bacteria) TaxID=192944 RepID=UPI00365A8C05